MGLELRCRCLAEVCDPAAEHRNLRCLVQFGLASETVAVKSLPTYLCPAAHSEITAAVQRALQFGYVGVAQERR